MKLVRNLIILAVLAVIAILAAAYFSINTLIKKGVESAGPLALKAETRLESASVLPFTGTGKLSKLSVGNPDGFKKTPYALKVDGIHVKVNLPSIKTDTVVIDSIRIEAPDLFIEGGLMEKNNLTALQHNAEAFSKSSGKPKTETVAKTEASNEKAKPGKKVVVKDLVITGAKVHWVSTLTLGQEVLLPLPDIHLQNIGEEKKGVTWAELGNLVLNEVFKASSSVSGKNLNKALDQIKANGVENLNKAADGLKGLLRR